MTDLLTRRTILSAAMTGALVGLLTLGHPAWAQDHGGGSGGGGSGRGGSGGGGSGGGGHLIDGGDDTEHSHDDTEHTDTDHEHTEHDPDFGTDHADGKKGPRYRGGRAATGRIGRGRGHSLEDRVLKDH